MSSLQYRAYYFTFTGGVHFGQGVLEQTEYAFRADTLFSALCHEAIKQGSLERLVDLAISRRLMLTDAFPYRGSTLFLPKPYTRVETKLKDHDVKERKAFKNLKFLPVGRIREYVAGDLTAEHIAELSFGKSISEVSVSIRGEEETRPYRVGTFYFEPDCGLYVIVGAMDNETCDYVEELLESLSYSGIGGKRSSGLGRFVLRRVPDKNLSEITNLMKGEYKEYMSLSISVPEDGELERVLEGARYELKKLSGFVFSESYAEEFHRKKDIYAFCAGSCFTKPFRGSVIDVSSGGKHPVYRYANPLFMGVR